ncbi:MAG: Mur ligase family protein, partial [Clostridia bacterium]|nr:Mur ligase family protein [Clostridia bacterium]
MVKIDKIVIYLCKFISKVLKALGGGSSLPGKIALKVLPGILKRAAEGYKVIMVTGTNGKTTTSSMITGILENAGYKVVSNTSGANMIDGIVTCFINNYKKGEWAVIECDEAYTRIVNRFIKPEYMVLTNVFRDQLDRFGEVSNTWGKIKDAIELSPKTKLVANGDLPLFSKIEGDNPIYYFGFSEGFAKMSDDVEPAFCPECGEKFRYRHITVKNMGDYYCPECGFKRPDCEYLVGELKNVTSESSEITIAEENIKLSVAGLYNIYNALAAFAVTHLMGVPKGLIKAGIEKQQSCFGRDEVIKVGDNSIQISLIKNPTGCDLCIETIALCKEKCNLL